MHRSLKKEYLQYCLNEFCYKFNRRYFGEKMFDRFVFCRRKIQNKLQIQNLQQVALQIII